MTTLTPRQLDVLRLLAEGLTYQGIAVRLGTVMCHMKGMRRALGAQSGAQAVAIGFRRGLIR